MTIARALELVDDAAADAQHALERGDPDALVLVDAARRRAGMAAVPEPTPASSRRRHPSSKAR